MLSVTLAPLLQTLRTQPKPGAVPGKQLEPGLRLVAEREHVARERILIELGAHQLVKALETEAQVGGARAQEHLR